MKKSFKKIVAFLLIFFPITTQGEENLRALYNSLDPKSLTKALAFYELYPESIEGKEALKRAEGLLCKDKKISFESVIPFMHLKMTASLSEEAIGIVDALGDHFPNRLLKGYKVAEEREVIDLLPEEIDLGTALLLSQLGDKADLNQVRSYNAMLDLMALMIQSSLRENPGPEEKIQAINTLIFEEMRYRFPPHSLYAKDIDLYTFLPSVMDNHLGVCLGVTTLYLALAQRLDLPLEIITPPGHIYLRYHDEKKLINIETTARGIHLPTEEYLNVSTPSLEPRSIKEVVGMTHVNQASVYLQQGRFEEAVSSYEKACFYQVDDPMVTELLGYCYVLTHREEKGRELLLRIKALPPDKVVVKRTLAEDYLDGKVDSEGMKAIFLFVDERRESVSAKQKQLEAIVEKYPEFREGLEQLAVAWLQLNREKEALKYLIRYHDLDSSNPTIEYYLAALHGERHDYTNAWLYLKNAEALTKAKGYMPKALQKLRQELILHSPE